MLDKDEAKGSLVLPSGGFKKQAIMCYDAAPSRLLPGAVAAL